MSVLMQDGQIITDDDISNMIDDMILRGTFWYKFKSFFKRVLTFR